jgi:LmbE family N-acetylglucosaminyl deacetylase
MTDGRASHRALISEDELVRIRHDEAENAALQLGLTAADYLFLDFEDDRLMKHRDGVCDRVVQA